MLQTSIIVGIILLLIRNEVNFPGYSEKTPVGVFPFGFETMLGYFLFSIAAPIALPII